MYLGNLPIFKVVRVLLHATREPHLRELAAACSLSPGGTVDVLRRLSERGVLRQGRVGNRTTYRLELSKREESVLSELFASYNLEFLESRIETFSRNAAEKLSWMDETYAFFKDVKQGRRDTA